MRSNGFHREDLRRELLDAARAYVSEQGHEGLSVRQIAQLVGVSPGAPYHHFPDRRSLLLSVAIDGYRRLTSSSAQLDEETPPEERLFDLLRHFLQFAAENPRLFALMYESELTRPFLEPAIGDAQLVGFGLLREAVLALKVDIPEDELGVRIATVWSAIYGFALMRARQMIHPHDEIRDPMSDKLADAIVRQALRLILT